MQCSTCQALTAENAALKAEVHRRGWNPYLGMLNQAGLLSAMDTLPWGFYTLFLIDVDDMKAINTATGAHEATDEYLKAGFRVREEIGEIIGQLRGDEISCVLREGADPEAFIRRLRAQFKAQVLKEHERAFLEEQTGLDHITVTAAWRKQVSPDDMRSILRELAIEVLERKTSRKAGGRRDSDQ